MDETNGRVMQRAFDEIMKRGHVDAIDELFASDFVGHDTSGDVDRGIQGGCPRDAVRLL